MRNFVFLIFVAAAAWAHAQPMYAPYGLAVSDAELRFMLGIHSSAVDLELGRHGPADYTGAASAYRKAAVLGFPLAQNNLARLYETGRGVPRNFVLAHMWYSLAAAGGEALAQANLEASARRLGPEEIAKAEGLAHELKRHLPNPIP